jgi:zinc transport system substrate-binding protein
MLRVDVKPFPSETEVYMRHSIFNIVFSCLFSWILIPQASATDKLSAFVSIIPQKYFVEQIGKDLVDVEVMVRPGANPANYEPKPRQMADLSKTQVYFSIGVPFENFWLKKIAAANPKMKIAQTDRGIEKIRMTVHHHHDEAGEHHEAGKPHEPGAPGYSGLDPHIWLSPPLVMIQARTILSVLQEIDPTHRAVYEANYKAFISEIVDLDCDLKKIFAGRSDLQFMVFHPAWGYFAQAYGLKQVPIEIEGKEPKPAQLKDLIKYAREDGIKVVFVQPQFSTKSAQLIAKEIGGEVAIVDSLAEDWSANLRQVASKFKAALK